MWLEHLKQKRKTPGRNTKEMQLKKLSGWGLEKAIQAIQNSISGGWQGLFEPKVEFEKPAEDTFWKDKARFDMVEKEIQRIESQASHTAMDMIIQPQDVERYTKLKSERKLLKAKLNL
jgi:hypothetical protein